jgi:Flp pilus assembly protein TadD
LNGGQYSPPSGPAYDFWQGVVGRYSSPFNVDVAEGIDALEAGNYAKAETVFEKLLQYPVISQTTDPTIRFYLGVAEMNLGKWDEAKTHLKTAARRLRRLPDPKSRLGVAYAKLGDVDGANVQRAALVRMGEACKGTCKDSQFISDGIQMIDQALAQPPAVKPESRG